jgi:hypothetical protein
MELLLELALTCIYWKIKTFVVRVTLTQMMVHKLHIVDWQYKLSIDCTCSPQVYRGSEWVMTNGATTHQYTSPLSVLATRQRRQVSSTTQLKRLDTSHNKHWLMQWKWIWCRVCSAEREREREKKNSSVENAIYGCVPPTVSRYITPNCISEDQIALKWKSGTHKCQ